jgi:hypothetical protein
MLLVQSKILLTFSSQLFPREFIDETRRTLSLLFPQADHQASRWFRGQAVKNHLDRRAGDCQFLKAEERNTAKFTYWRDRLIIAKEVFDDHEPRGLIQSWRDNRRAVQWWTFWIAIVVFILAVVQVTEGALQVYKAFHPS